MLQASDLHRFRVDEYDAMIHAGILKEDDRVELLDGMIVAMAPIGSLHAWCAYRLTQLFMRLAGPEVIVWSQNPVVLGDYSEPQPDVALLRADASFGPERLPEAASVLLMIEVADSSGSYDRSTKAPLYARAGVQEYWIVDVVAERIDVFLGPEQGAYRVVCSYRRGETLAPTSLSAAELTIDELLD